jgi:hypothetical protein
MNKRPRLRVTALALSILALGSLAQAQDFPPKKNPSPWWSALRPVAPPTRPRA